MNGWGYLRGATVLHIKGGHHRRGPGDGCYLPLCDNPGVSWPSPLAPGVFFMLDDPDMPNLPVCKRCAAIAEHRAAVLIANARRDPSLLPWNNEDDR